MDARSLGMSILVLLAGRRRVVRREHPVGNRVGGGSVIRYGPLCTPALAVGALSISVPKATFRRLRIGATGPSAALDTGGWAASDAVAVVPEA